MENKELLKVTLLTYDKNTFNEVNNYNISDIKDLNFDEYSFVWIKVDGREDFEAAKEIGKFFDIHDLVIEDIVNKEQRPKIEDYGDYIHITLKNIFYDYEKEEILSYQISIILGSNFIISFHEKEEDMFLDLINKIKLKGTHIKEHKADYIAYSIIDKAVDNYFIVLEEIEQKIEILDEILLSDGDDKQLQNIKDLKKQILFLRRCIWPFKEAIDRLEDFDSDLIKENNYIYFKDVKDHLISMMDAIEICRESTSEMVSIHLSIISNKMNSVMKALAVVSIIFMPLTLISGIYGMNFENMPGLNHRYGYYYTLIGMTFIAISLIFYFKKRKWM